MKYLKKSSSPRRFVSVLLCLVLALCFFGFPGCGKRDERSSSSVPVQKSSDSSQGKKTDSSSMPLTSSSAVVSSSSMAATIKPQLPTSGVRVLMYHDIMTPAQKGSSTNGLVVTTDDFDHQMSILKQAGFSTMNFDELKEYIDGKYDGTGKVVLTFDDGYRTCGYLAAPILKKYGFRATIFIITKYLDQPDDDLNTTSFFPLQYFHQDELAKFSYALDYASHTNNMHDDYKGKPMLISESSDKILSDLQASRQKLSQTTAIAYPFGKYSDETLSLVRQAGFTMGFTTKPRIVKPGADLLTIPRFEVNAPMTDRHFKSIMGIKS